MENPLPNDVAQAIMDGLEPIMIRHDYQRRYQQRNGTWYLFNSELLRIFDFQAGEYRNKAYFNLGLVLRSLDDSTRPRIFDCSVYGRLDSLVPDVEQFELATSFGVPGMTTAERIAYIVKTVQTVVLPFHAALNTVEDVRRFVCSPQTRRFRVLASAKHILGCI